MLPAGPIRCATSHHEAAMTDSPRRVAVYARVSTFEQTAENQLLELRRYVEARGWTATEYVDHGVSGAKDRRPALDQLIADVRRHKFEAVLCWRLDRLGRNLRHLVLLLDEWQSRGVAFVTLGEGIDTSHRGGQARRGRPRLDRGVRARADSGAHPCRAGAGEGAGQAPRSASTRACSGDAAPGLTVRQAAVLWNVSKSTAARRLAAQGGAPPRVGQSLKTGT